MNPSFALRPNLSGGFSPSCFFRAGFGSKVSTWDGPPFMNRKMTRLARAGKCVREADSLEVNPNLPAACKVPARPRRPNPMPACRSMSRREIIGKWLFCIMSSLQQLQILDSGLQLHRPAKSAMCNLKSAIQQSIDKQHLIGSEQHLSVLLPPSFRIVASSEKV